MTGSFNVTGLLGGAAASIDTTALVAQLVAAAAIPQSELKDQLTSLTAVQNAYQAINTDAAAMQSAGRNLTDAGSWSATAATSSVSSVVATSDTTAMTGSTTFSVTKLAQTQVDTAVGATVADLTAGITITVAGTGTYAGAHIIKPTATDTASIATAINATPIGVHATVVTDSTGTSRLQLTSMTSGAAGAFTSSGFTAATAPQTAVLAQDAQVTVGDTSAGGYTMSSSSNTFTGVIPGVTFSVSALASNVSISVASDPTAISNKVKALVTAANNLTALLSSDDAQGGVLQGKMDVRTLAMSIMSSVSGGTATSGSMNTYGIDMDKNGVLTFNATTFASAYAANPTTTQSMVAGSFAAALNTAADAAIAPITGTVSQSLTSGADQATRLNDEINDWTPKLASITANLTAKFNTMQTMMAKLQTQQTYLTSMFASITASQTAK